MPIFFGNQPPTLASGKKPAIAPALEKKGIELLRSAPSDIVTIGMPLAKTSFWAIFEKLFSVILYSLYIKTGVSLSPENQEIDDSHRNPLPFTLPPICTTPSSTRQSSYDCLLQLGFEQVEMRGKTYFLHGQPTRKIIQTIVSKDFPARLDERCFTPQGYCNLSALYTSLDLQTWFSFASQALRFSTTFDEKVDTSAFASIGTEEGTEMEDIETSGLSKETASKKRGRDYHQIANLFKGDIPGSLLDKIPSGEVLSGCLKSEPVFFNAESVPVKSYGLVCRYVPELALSDKETVINFVQRYLYQNLGQTENDRFRVFLETKAAWGILKDTPFGHELSHLAKTMTIAFDTQTSCMPIFDSGFYEGCVLEGYGFALGIQDSVIRPLGLEELQVEIRSMATHAGALNQIAEFVLREFKGITKDMIMKCENMYTLRNLLGGIPLTGPTTEAIISAAAFLRFPTRPWTVNLTSVKHMIEISHNLGNLKPDYPIGPRALFSLDPIEVAMSCFSEGTCPSFLHPNGTPIDLRGRLPRASDFNRRQENTRGKQAVSNASWTFAVRRVRFDEAVGDIRKVLKEGTARSVSSSVARGTGCIVFSGTAFAEIFAKLGDLVAVSEGSSHLISAVENTRVIGGRAEADDVGPSDGRRSKKVKI